jgi:hypothetical protein
MENNKAPGPDGFCNTPLFVTLIKSCLVSQKWGPTKTFWANLWKRYFLLVCFGCYVNDVCLSCLLNTFVNQHNLCALVIMLLFMLLAIFQNHYLGKLSFLFKLFYFIQTSTKIYFWDKAFIKTKYLQNYLDLQSRVVPLFSKLLFCSYL